MYLRDAEDLPVAGHGTSLRTGVRKILPALRAAAVIGLALPAAADEAIYLSAGSSWRYFPGVSEPSPADPTSWYEPDFNDAAWQTAPAPFGYNESEVVTDLGALDPPMRGSYTTLYLRTTMEVADPRRLSSLQARIDYDDGFVLWINGEELLRVNVEGPAGNHVPFDARASRSHESGRPVVFELPDPGLYIRPGQNVVAVQGLNSSPTNADFFLDVEIVDPTGPDMIPPQVAQITPLEGSVLRELTWCDVTFSEPVRGVSAASLRINGLAATGVRGEGAGPYRFFFPPLSPGPVTVWWSTDHGITDTADPPNRFAGESWSYTLDPTAPLPQLVLNEIMALNVQTLRDEDREYPDWIELANEGGGPVDLAGFALSDDPLIPQKWIFPRVTIGPGQYLVVFASGKDRRPEGGELHTNFKLNENGEYLALFSPDTPPRPISAFDPQFPPQRRDRTYGRLESGELRYFLTPTPGEKNTGETAQGVVEDPVFSVPHGVYDEAFSLTLRTPTEGARIYFRTDPEGRAVTDQNGQLYTGPIEVAGSPRQAAVMVRAVAYKHRYLPSRMVSRTYIFREYVLVQPRQPPGFPQYWGNRTRMVGDYEMDRRVTQDPAYTDMIMEALRESPTVSIVMDIDDLFDPQRGIYSNGQSEGIAWERPCSFELIYPGGHTGCQVNCGIRVQGGSSTNPWKSPKLSLRVAFRGDWGPTELRFPLFPDSPVQRFDTLVLDAHLNLTWIHPSAGQQIPSQYVRDAFCSDLQNAMGSYAPHNVFVNLYLNGVHWGMYEIHERADEHFAASYLGGRPEDYDLFKHDGNQLMEGTREAWNMMMQIARGGLAEWDSYLAVQEYLDVADLCDYMIMNLYVGNDDWPRHNWYAARNRVLPGSQFHFFSWDAEHVLKDVNINLTGVNEPNSPAELYWRLRQNREFLLLFADHVHRHFSPGGVLWVDPDNPQWDPDHPERNMPAMRYMERIREIDKLIAVESARWGDYRRPSRPYTRNEQWMAELNKLLRTYFPLRSERVLRQFQSAALYPRLAAPQFVMQGTMVDPFCPLRIHLPEGTEGTVYFTLDGTDPRESPSGEVAAGATPYTEPVLITGPVTVKARTYDGAVWSALAEENFTVTQPFAFLKVSEIMYHPPADPGDLPWRYEFLEVRNAGPDQLDLTAVAITQGVSFVFPEGAVLRSGASGVICADSQAFRSRYPGVPVLGVYRGRLDDDGETLVFRDPEGRVILQFWWRDAGWWPPGTDGKGYSLAADPQAYGRELSGPGAWKRSAEILGSPGRDDPAFGPSAPRLIAEPTDIVVEEGMRGRFSAVAYGVPVPSYTWQRNGSDLPDSHTAFFTTGPVTLQDDGTRYRCRIANEQGTVLTREAVLHVRPAGVAFRRGDANQDERLTVSDAAFMLRYLFGAGEPSAARCLDAFDSNDDGRVNVADPLALLGTLFTGTSILPEPAHTCGGDPSPDALSCSSFSACP